MSTIQPHNEKPAAAWGSAGAEYEVVSRSIESAIDHVIQRVSPRAGEKVLDVATGTGLAARRVAEWHPGTEVHAVDISQDLVEVAKQKAKAFNLNIDYRVGDAEKLPFGDGEFDVVISTFGHMFSSKPDVVAAELARVTKKGGRLGLATWAPSGTVFEFFLTMKPFLPPPPSPPPPSPFEWGKKERVKELLGSAFDLRFEDAVGAPHMVPTAEAGWELYTTCYGPSKMLAKNLPDDKRAEFKSNVLAYHTKYKTDVGVMIPREYLITVGTRK